MAHPVKPAQVTVDGRSVRYIAGGDGDEAFVFVHGFGADHTTWMLTLPAFFAHGRVFALDLPGHGRSAADVGDGSIATLAGILDGFLDAIALPRAHLVGHSLGGAIVTELALTRPSKVASLSLVAPAGFGPTINRDYVTQFPELADPIAARTLLEHLVANPRLIGDQIVGDVLAYLGRNGVRDALKTIAAAVFPAGNQAIDYRQRISRIGLPIKVIWGAEDRILAVAEPLAPHLPINVIPRAGHLVHLEVPTRVNRLILPSAPS